VQLFKSDSLLISQKIGKAHDIQMKIIAEGAYYSFYYATKPNKWILLKDQVDARFLSTRVAGGFVGCMYALYATSSGKPSSAATYFDWFEYVGNDEIY
jgi:alpha-N-arabinofuranosidase